MGSRRAVYGAVLAAVTAAGGCHLLIGYRDAVLGCVPDGVRSDDETGVDCGGTVCGPCPAGEGCATGADCETRVCIAGTCREPSCTDGVQDGEEVDVDCGGAASGCPGCAEGRRCEGNADCASGICREAVCMSHYVWARQFGGARPDRVATDRSGNLVVTGIIREPGDVGGNPLGGADIFVATYDSAGNHLWSRGCGDGFEGGGVIDVVFDSSGDILLIAGDYEPLDFGGGPLGGVIGDYNSYLVKLRVDGIYGWGKHLGVAPFAAIAFDEAANEIFMAGAAYGPIDFGGGSLSTTPEPATFAARLTASGEHVWSSSYPQSEGQFMTRTTAGLAITGGLEASVDFGGGPLPVTGTRDRFVVALTSSGVHMWSRSFSFMAVYGPAISPSGIVGDDGGNVFVIGAFGGVLDFGGGPLVSAGYPEADADDIFVVKFGPEGQHLWSKRFGGAEHDYCSASALDAEDNLVLVCTSPAGADFGNGLVQGTVLLKLDPEGNYVWSKGLSNSLGGLAVMDLGVASSGHVVLAGQLEGTFDLGGGPMTSQSGADFVIAKFLLP